MYGCNLRNILDQFATKNVPSDNYWPTCVNSLVTNKYFKKIHCTNKSKIHLVIVIRKKNIFPCTD